jgi:hypothetical protein
MNDAEIDVPDAAVDETTHALDLELDGAHAELVVTRERLDVAHDDPVAAVRDHDIAAIAGARAEIDAAMRAEFAILGAREGEAGGAPVAEICSRFRSGDGVVYQRRAHVRAGGASLMFALRGPLAARAACDAVLDRVLESIRFRHDEA